jgi:hypothetical protein
MEMVWQEGPGVNLEPTFFSEVSKSGKEIVSILIRQEDWPFLNASAHDMMEDAGSV